MAGGELRFPMVADQPPLLIHVDEATRPTTVRWTVTECTFMEDWVGTQPTFTITPIDNGSCELNFEHRGLNDELECKDMCSRSWDHFVGTSLRETGRRRHRRSQPQPTGPRPPRRRGEQLDPGPRGLLGLTGRSRVGDPCSASSVVTPKGGSHGVP